MSSSESQFAQASAFRPSTGSLGDSQIILEERSTGESTGALIETTQEQSVGSQVAADSSSAERSGDSTTQSASGAHQEFVTQPEIEVSSGENLPLSSIVEAETATGPEKTSHTSTQAESPTNRQPDFSEISSSLPFQTQVPFLESENNTFGVETVESVEVR